MKHDVRLEIIWRFIVKVSAQCIYEWPLFSIRVDHGNARLCDPACNSCDHQPHNSRTDNCNPVSRTSSGIPMAIECCFYICCQNRSFGTHRIWNWDQHFERCVEHVLMRVQAENPAANQLIRPYLDRSSRAIAVFYWEGKFAALKWRAHVCPFRFGDGAFENETFCSPADAGKFRVHLSFMLSGVFDSFWPQFDLPIAHIPKRTGNLSSGN